MFSNQNTNTYRKNLLTFCHMGNLQVVRKICTNPRQKHEIFLRDDHNRTALHIAVIHLRVEIVKYLLDQPGIDVRARTDEGDTALSLGCRHRFVPLEIIALLIAKDRELVNLVNNDCRSPLQMAFQPRRPDVVRFLIEEGGADPNYKDNNGEHAFFYAVRHFEMVTINFLMNETKCDIKQRNDRDQAAFEAINFHSILKKFDMSEHFLVKMFRSTYNQFTSPKVLGGVLRFCINSSCNDRPLTQYVALKQAILETFYESPHSNPDHYELVTRIKVVNGRYGDKFDPFWLCLPLQSQDVLEQFGDTIFRNLQLNTMFSLYKSDREVFEDYLPIIAQNVSYYQVQTLHYFDQYANDPSSSCYLLDFFKSICWMGFNVDFTFSDCRSHQNLKKILYPLLPFDRPFISAPTKLDTKVCRHFEETDSVEDVESYKVFKYKFCEGLSFGYVPTLFNLTRTVVRRTVFQAAGSSSNKLFNLHTLTLELPITIKERLFYLPV